MNNLSEFLALSPQKLLTGHAHICLYASILVLCEKNGQLDTIHVTRKELMVLSQIKSNATYHKCMRELVNSGYVEYTPSYHPSRGSQIVILSTEGDSLFGSRLQ